MNHHPLYAAGRRGLIAVGCVYSNAADPNFRASVQRAGDLAQGYEMRPFEADAGQRQQHAGRGSWSARAVRNPYSRHPGRGWTTMAARPGGHHYEERVMGKSGTSGNAGKGGGASNGTRQSAGGSNSGGGARPGAGTGQGPGNAGGWPSTTGGTSGGGRSNGKPR